MFPNGPATIHSAVNDPPAHFRLREGRGRGKSRQVLGGEISQLALFRQVFRSFPGLARHLNSVGHRQAGNGSREKGSLEMSSQSPLTRTLVAIAAALAMSTVAIGAAVGPAQANAAPNANPVKVSINA
jgi:hypothetical protein